MIQQIGVFAVLTPLLFLTVFFDLKYFRIPNMLVLAILAVFLVGVAPFLTMEELYRRGVLAIIVLAAGIVFVLLRAIGVGDIKASTVFVLFLEDYELALFMIALALASVVGLMMLKVMRPFVLRKNYEAIAEWQCWHDRQHFPFGFALAGALFMVVGIRVLATFLGYPG